MSPTEQAPAPSIAVLDYGAGNLRSASRALAHQGADAWITADPDAAADADALVVPGVGHFGQCVRQFVAGGLDGLVRDWAAARRPLLGICVGMQILYESSEEDPSTPGLGLLPGRVRRLPETLLVPHMGWNTVEAVQADPLLEGVDGEQAYFVHSYYAEPASAEHVRARCRYAASRVAGDRSGAAEIAFAAAVRVGRFVATQFHPEKSSVIGGRLLANFVAEVAAARIEAGR